MTSLFETPWRPGRWIFAPVLILGVVTLAEAAEANPPALASGPPASGAYGEKLDLVTDASVAESLARQKTLSFSSVRIDGETSDVSLSALTAGQILNAVATKVPTPDLDADAVGGLLQLTSRRAFDQEERTLRGNLAVSYDPLVGEVQPDASITYGRSLGTEKRRGFLATFEQRLGRDQDESIELNWDSASGQLDRFRVGEQRERTVETNFNGSFDWKVGDRGVVFVRTEAQFSKERDDGRTLEYDLPSSILALPPSGGSLGGVTLKHLLEDGERRRDSFSLAAGASHQSERWLLDLRSTFQASRDRRLDDRNYDFEERNISVIYRRGDPSFPLVSAPDGTLPGDAARQLLGEVRIRDGKERSSDAVISFDATRFAQDRGQPGWLKSGVKVRLRRTTEQERSEVFDPAAGGVRVSDFARGAQNHILEGRYALAGFPDFGSLKEEFRSHPERLVWNESRTRGETDPANYDVRENVVAGYAMANLPVKTMRIVAGLRAEQTASRFAGYEVAFDEAGNYGGTTRLAARRTKTDLFPGVHVSRPLAKNLTGFASWTRSIRRPEYTDLVPARRIARADREIDEGNADLRSTLYTNYDLAFDYAYRDGGRVSLELFHRDIRDPSLTRRTLLGEGQFAGYERTRPENGGSAWLRGLEVTWEQELAAISRRLEGVEFKAHYTRQDSRQAIENRSGEVFPLAGRPGHQLSVQLSYDRAGYYASLELEHSSRTLDSIGRRANEDRFAVAANHWNLSLSREFRKDLRIFLDAKNLTATPDRRYVGDPTRPDSHGIDLRQYRLGMKWEK